MNRNRHLNRAIYKKNNNHPHVAHDIATKGKKRSNLFTMDTVRIVEFDKSESDDPCYDCLQDIERSKQNVV